MVFVLLQEKLPAAKQGGEPLPEGLMWLLLTGEVRVVAHARVRRWRRFEVCPKQLQAHVCRKPGSMLCCAEVRARSR